MKQVDMYKRVALIALMGMSLAGCSTVKGWFAGKDAAAKKAQEPAELVKFEPSVKVDKLWSTGVGKGEGHIGVRQRPAVADGKVYAAAITGGVQALDLQTGKRVWEYKPKKEERNDRKFKQRLSGGPGVGEGLVVIGTLSGDVIALNQADGTEKWRAKVPNEVIAAPAIAQSLVLVRSNDGRVSAFDAATGERRWFHAEEGPTLSVRGNAPIVTGPGVVFVGNDVGTLSALALQDGRPLWEQAIGVPEGRTELERMSDVDGAPVLDGTTLYATSFKNETLALEGPSGRPLWTRDHGGAGAVPSWSACPTWTAPRCWMAPPCMRPASRTKPSPWKAPVAVRCGHAIMAVPVVRACRPAWWWWPTTPVRCGAWTSPAVRRCGRRLRLHAAR